MLKRIGWFILINVLVLVTINITLSLIGMGGWGANVGMGSQQGLGMQSLLIFSGVVGFSGALISLAMSRMMAKWMMGVRLVNPNSPGQEGWVARKVLEICRMAGLPEPQVGIYNSDDVNAFATGPTKSRALVAVSSGLLSRMTQDEAEGVLAHEVAHIKNGDMVTMTLIQGVVNTFAVFLSNIIAFAAGQAVEAKNRYWVQFAVHILCSIVLTLLGSMAVSYYSRRREFVADSGSAKLVGSSKMIAALRKLQQLQGSLAEIGDAAEVNRARPDAVAALQISGKRASGFALLLATHPPLEERIESLRKMRV